MSLQQFQIDVGNQVSTALVDVPVFIFRPRAALTAVQIQSKIDGALGALTALGGKSGLAVTVLMPLLDIDADKQEIPGPYLHIKCTVRCQENPVVNMGPNGTGIACEDLAIAVSQALHLWTPGGTAGIVRASRNAITPNLQFEGKITYDVQVESEFDMPVLGDVITPAIAVAGGNVTLSTPTGGAAIFYTVDGSTPGLLGAISAAEAVSTATLYSGPFAAPAAGKLLRCAAYVAGSRGSDINWEQF